MNKTATIIGLITGAFVILGMMLWGVPWYIKGQVAHEVGLVHESLAPPAGIATNNATILAVQQQLTAMETRMIDRDKLFIEYLERQASRND